MNNYSFDFNPKNCNKIYFNENQSFTKCSLNNCG